MRKSRLGRPKEPRGMIARIRALVRDEGGATAVEYALIVSAIAGLIIVVVFFLGNKVNNEFSNVASHLP